MPAAYPPAVRRFGPAARACRTEPRARPTSWEAAPPRPTRRVVVRLWLPVTPLFWVLSPFALLVAPFAWWAPRPWRPANPYAAALAIGRLLTSVGGMIVRVDTPDCLVSIRIL